MHRRLILRQWNGWRHAAESGARGGGRIVIHRGGCVGVIGHLVVVDDANGGVAKVEEEGSEFWSVLAFVVVVVVLCV